MMKLLRLLACLALAVAMASVSLAASAHGTVVVDEAGVDPAAPVLPYRAVLASRDAARTAGLPEGIPIEQVLAPPIV